MEYTPLPKSYKKIFPFKLSTTSYIYPDHILPNVAMLTLWTFFSARSHLIHDIITSQVKPYLLASHQSAERGHKIILEILVSKLLLNLDLRLGERTGISLGIFLVEASLKILGEMATSVEAGVSRKYD